MTDAHLPLTPHKRDMLRAWLDGKTIQLREIGECWVDWGAQHPPLFLDPDDYYRIKPEPETVPASTSNTDK